MKTTTFFDQTFCGTPNYLAPEVIKASGGAGPYSLKVDCWSLGMYEYRYHLPLIVNLSSLITWYIRSINHLMIYEPFYFMITDRNPI